MSEHLDMPDRHALLVSIKPQYAELILDGTKTVELRRVRPHVQTGATVLIYASSPAMEMVGTATVAAVDVRDAEAIWAEHGSAAGIDRAAYDEYFAGSDQAVAITLTNVRPLRRRVPLTELRQRITGFNPPQSFRYLGVADAAVVV